MMACPSNTVMPGELRQLLLPRLRIKEEYRKVVPPRDRLTSCSNNQIERGM